MRIPWLKVTVFVLMLVVLLKLGSLITGIATLISSTQPPLVQAQETLPIPGSDPISIPNNPLKRGQSIDLSGQDGKINLLDQKTRGVIQNSGTPVYINRRPGQEDDSGGPKRVIGTDWSQDQISLRENETFLELLTNRLDEREAFILQRQAKLEEALKRYDSANDDRILRLVSVYSTMKSKSAARIFNDLDIDTLLPVAQSIIPRKLAPILADMDPEKARVLSEELSGRSLNIEALRDELSALKQEQDEIDSTKQTLRTPELPAPETADQPPLLPPAQAIGEAKP